MVENISRYYSNNESQKNKPISNMNSLIKLVLFTTLPMLFIYYFLSLASVDTNTPTPTPLPSDWLSGWSNRVKMTIDQTQIDANLSDFPVLVHLSPSSGIKGDDLSYIFKALGKDANRKKIAFTTSDGITQIYAEIEKWDTANNQAWVWVKVPSISDMVNTDLYLYYDITHADNTTYIGDIGSTPAEEVWTNGFVGVWHLAEQGNGINGKYKDSTSHHNNGIGGGGNVSKVPGLATGKIGNSPDFDGIDDIIVIPDNDDYSVITNHAISISFWYSLHKLNQSIDGAHWFSPLGKGDYSAPIFNAKHEYKFNFYDDPSLIDGVTDSDRTQRRSFYLCDNDSGLCAGNYAQYDYNYQGQIPPDVAGGWAYFVGQADNQYVYAYRNAILGHAPIDYINYSDNPIRLQHTDTPLILGSYGDSSNSGWLNGSIDELRVSKLFRSNAWIKADYNSQNDSLLTYQ